MRRFGVTATTALIAAVGALGLTGCGGAEGPARLAEESAVEVMAAMGAEGQALVAMGFDADDVAADAVPAEMAAAPAASPTGKGTKGEHGEGARKRHPARVLLRRNTLHGEAVVQTKDGTKTVAVQRGTVTAIDGTTMTVKSSDGFTMTWTFGDRLRVVERRANVRPDQVKVGTVLGVAGTKDGDRRVARLIVIPRKK